MPWIWKAGMAVLVLCLLASMAIAIVRLATTPTAIGARVESISPAQAREFQRRLDRAP